MEITHAIVLHKGVATKATFLMDYGRILEGMRQGEKTFHGRIHTNGSTTLWDVVLFLTGRKIPATDILCWGDRSRISSMVSKLAKK